MTVAVLCGVGSERTYVHGDVCAENFVVADSTLAITLGSLDSLVRMKERLFAITRTCWCAHRCSRAADVLADVWVPCHVAMPWIAVVLCGDGGRSCCDSNKGCAAFVFPARYSAPEVAVKAMAVLRRGKQVKSPLGKTGA